MKRTLSIVYRICYIFFSLWAFGFLIFPLSPAALTSFLSFAPIVNLLGLICIIPILIMTIKKQPGKGRLHFKALCAFLSLLLIMCNLDILSSPYNPNWIICILLPAMMVLDWILFDKKGLLGIGDVLLWLSVLTLIGLILFTVLNNILRFGNAAALWGLFKNKTELLSLALKSLICGALIYAADAILSGKQSKSLSSKIALLWRLVFLALESHALFAVSHKNLTVFINSLTDFAILANFLSFLCILAVLLYNLIKYSSLFKQSSPFPRVKGIFTFCIASAFLIFHFISNGRIESTADKIIYLIGPLMMLFDWILFDSKGEFRIYEPFIWLIIPILHFFAVQAINGFVSFDPVASLKQLAVLLCAGFVILIADRLLNRI